jgi:hypothetical protein
MALPVTQKGTFNGVEPDTHGPDTHDGVGEESLRVVDR